MNQVNYVIKHPVTGQDKVFQIKLKDSFRGMNPALEQEAYYLIKTINAANHYVGEVMKNMPSENFDQVHHGLALVNALRDVSFSKLSFMIEAPKELPQKTPEFDLQQVKKMVSQFHFNFDKGTLVVGEIGCRSKNVVHMALGMDNNLTWVYIINGDQKYQDSYPHYQTWRHICNTIEQQIDSGHYQRLTLKDMIGIFKDDGLKLVDYLADE